MNKFFKILFSIFFVLLFETSVSNSEETKIKIGVLAPLSGEDASLGKQILNSIRMALIDIKNNNIEIYPKDTRSDPDVTLRSALEFEKMGISLVIGPVFYKNLFDQLEKLRFLPKLIDIFNCGKVKICQLPIFTVLYSEIQIDRQNVRLHF